MTRAARRASLLVAFSLLTSAATASAECAWVLWIFTVGKNLTDHSVESAHATKRECDATVRDYAEPLKRRGYTVRGGLPGMGGLPGVPEVIGEKADTTVKYFCLPDTVDPRGPKGK